MKIIWQELAAIFADIWGGITEAGRDVHKFIVSNRPQITVLLTLGLTGLGLIVYFLVGACSFFGAPIGRIDNPSYAPLPLEATCFAGFAGLALSCLTAELIERIQKRMSGKSKEDDTSEEAQQP